MRIGKLKSALSAEEQQKLYLQWKETNNDHYRIKLTIGYVSLIASLVAKSQLDHQKDIISEIVIKIYKKLEDYNPEKASVYTYIYRIVTTKLIDHYRKQKRYTNLFSVLSNQDILNVSDNTQLYCDYHKNDVTDEICKNEEKKLLLISRNKLSKKEDKVIEMKFYQQMSISKIMVDMKINRQAYDLLLASALDKIKKELKGKL